MRVLPREQECVVPAQPPLLLGHVGCMAARMSHEGIPAQARGVTVRLLSAGPGPAMGTLTGYSWGTQALPSACGVPGAQKAPRKVTLKCACVRACSAGAVRARG